jgi:hypothetical protein
MPSISEKKYMILCNNNEFKKKSLEDNIYFTLEDIHQNTSNPDICVESTEFANALTGHIQFEERTDAFQYTNILQNKEYVSNLIHWLNYIKEHSFDFVELQEDYKTNFIKYDDWAIQLEELKKILNEHDLNLSS